MRKAVLLGIGIALVIILLLVDSEPVTSTAVVPPNPAVLKAGLVTEGTLQVIGVTTDQWSENKAQVAAFEREADGGPWRQVGGIYSARIGQNGFTDGPSTRTDVTPSGSFGLVSSFGASGNPGTTIPYRDVDELDCWITDRDLEEFDRWVATPGCAPGFGDALLDPNGPLDLAIVTDHNAIADPTLPRRIFLRCYDYSPGRAPLPTSGDVSMRREDVLDLLRWLDPAKAPKVVLGVEDWLLGDASASWEELRYGDTGAAVSALQQALTSEGIPTTVDGLFYDETQANVRTFQGREDLPVTGVVDDETAAELGLYSG
jgi:L,D-peptidoglycan transpeptidase YkuD (ErfK/YbiS/YcfS/YnhG family)